MSETSPLLLASASPRRRELLGMLGVRFVVVTSRFNEASLAHMADPAEYTKEAALGKAREVAGRRAGIILGVDTDVFAPDGTILGKPADAEDAKRLLRLLSGATHTVYSGIALLQTDAPGSIVREAVQVVETKVTFGDLTDEAIEGYVKTGDPMDKAGAYGIQSGGMAFVTRIEGDLTNVIGLPLWTVGEMLKSFGVPLWHFDT